MKASGLQPLAIIPLALAIPGFVLSMLCLFAGTKPGYMEDYHIVTLNTSGLGVDFIDSLVPTVTAPAISKPTNCTAADCSKFPTISTNYAKCLKDNAELYAECNPVASAVASAGNAAASEAASLINSASNTVESGLASVVDKAAKELGIHQFYSLHLMNLCEGYYKPNATAPHVGKNVTECSNKTAMYHFDVIGPINAELAKAPQVFQPLNVTKLGIADDLQDGLNTLSTALNVTFVLYAIGIAAAGLTIIISFFAIFMNKGLVLLLDFLMAGLSFLTLMASSIIVTVVQKKATHIINKYGEKAGIIAYKGTKYLAITWAAFAAMVLACVFAAVALIKHRKNRKLNSNGPSQMSETKTWYGKSKFRKSSQTDRTLVE